MLRIAHSTQSTLFFSGNHSTATLFLFLRAIHETKLRMKERMLGRNVERPLFITFLFFFFLKKYRELKGHSEAVSQTSKIQSHTNYLQSSID